MRIPLSKPDIGEREIAYVAEVLRSGKLSLGPKLAEFEERFAKYAGARHAIATNSGTSALHLCVKALGIGEDDEVLTTSFSFVASVNSLLYEGATPVFADIDLASMNLDSKQILKVIEEDYAWDGKRLVNVASGRTLKAILPVHVFGLPCDMESILGIARAFKLRVIEDACEALGASDRGEAVGTIGDAGVFAFYPNKQITTAEGGMIVTNDARVANFCRSARNQGRDVQAQWLRHVCLGYNYRLSELHCALGLAQLERVDELLAARAWVAAIYLRELAVTPGIALPYDPSGQTRQSGPAGRNAGAQNYSRATKRSWFVYVIRVLGDSAPMLRNRLTAMLRERGIECQTYFQAIHSQPYFRNFHTKTSRPLPNTERASETCLALPFFPGMSEEQVMEVCAVVREVLAGRGPQTESNEAPILENTCRPN